MVSGGGGSSDTLPPMGPSSRALLGTDLRSQHLRVLPISRSRAYNRKVPMCAAQGAAITKTLNSNKLAASWAAPRIQWGGGLGLGLHGCGGAGSGVWPATHDPCWASLWLRSWRG